MRRERDARDVLIRILIAVVIVLLLVLAYFFVVKPQIVKHDYKVFNYGQAIGVQNIVQQVAQKGYVQIPVGQNQTLILIPYVPQNGQTGAPTQSTTTQ